MAGRIQKHLYVRTAKPSGFEIYWERGGELPPKLMSVFTSSHEANKAIKLFRATKNAKTTAN